MSLAVDEPWLSNGLAVVFQPLNDGSTNAKPLLNLFPHMPTFFPDLPPSDRADAAVPAAVPSRHVSRGPTARPSAAAGSRERTGAKGPYVRFDDRPLSGEQKLDLVKLSELAFKVRFQNTVGAIPSDKAQRRKAEAAFRQEQAEIAVGVRVSEALQKHWNDLKAHFEALIGESGAAFSTLMKAHSNGQRQAWHKLHVALRERGLDENYAGAIARSQFKKELTGLSEKQLWCIYFTITNRRSKGGAPRRRASGKISTTQTNAQIAAQIQAADIPF